MDRAIACLAVSSRVSSFSVGPVLNPYGHYLGQRMSTELFSRCHIVFSSGGQAVGEAGTHEVFLVNPTRLNQDCSRYLFTKTKKGEGIDWKNDPNVPRSSVGSWIAHSEIVDIAICMQDSWGWLIDC